MDIIISGYGIISAIGNGTEETLHSLLESKTGVENISYLPTEHSYLPSGEVKYSNVQLSELAGVDYPCSELRTVMLGIIAGKEAINSACLTGKDISKSAFINGTTVGGMDMTERYFDEISIPEDIDPENDSDVVSAKKYSKVGFNDCGIATELTAAALGNFSFVTTTSTACSSAANAIILGANMIRAGLTDIVIAGGSESLSRFHLNGFNSLMILDKDRSRPFDETRAGINLGEGAAYIVLESAESAKRRGITPLGILSGYANTCDAFHQTASSDNGEGAYLSMLKAIGMAGINPGEVNYINSHGTGTPNNDITELAAMQRIWGEHLPPFSSTKPLTGHTTSASGAIEAVISLLAIRNGFIPGNLGWKHPISNNAIPVLMPTPCSGIENVVCNSFGFGGNDSTLIISRYHSESLNEINSQIFSENPGEHSEAQLSVQ